MRGASPWPRPVRRCGACGKPAAVAVQCWEPDFPWGESWRIGTTPRAVVRALFRCQSCGATLRWAGETRWSDYGKWAALSLLALGFGVGAVIALLDAFFSFTGDSPGACLVAAAFMIGVASVASFFLFLSVRPRWRARRWPIVNAPQPPLRFAGPKPPLRVCRRCPGRAHAQSVSRGGPLFAARTYRYECSGCGSEFSISSWGGLVEEFFTTLVVIGFGLLIVLTTPLGWFVVGLGGLLGALPGRHLWVRLRHPVGAPRRF